MKLPTIRKQAHGRRRRGRGTSVWNMLTGKRGRTHRLSANVTSEGDWEVEVPQIRMSRAFAVMLVLHIVAVGGLFAFRIWGRDDEPATSAAVVESTGGPATISALDPAVAAEISEAPAEVIPPPTSEPVKTYIWHPGDSLPLVAASLGVSSSALREANPDKALAPGAELVVPRTGRVIVSPDSRAVEGQATPVFDPAAKGVVPAEPLPPKALVVPELLADSEIPDVLPSHESEAAATQARVIATTSVPAKTVPAKTAPEKAALAKTTPPKTKAAPPAPKAKPVAIVTTPSAPATPARVVGQRAHVVTKGDTVYSLARKYGFSAEEIAKANGLDAGYNIKLGQPLRIPVKR